MSNEIKPTELKAVKHKVTAMRESIKGLVDVPAVDESTNASTFPTSEIPNAGINQGPTSSEMFTNGMALVSDWEKLMTDTRTEGRVSGNVSTPPDWTDVSKRLELMMSEQVQSLMNCQDDDYQTILKQLGTTVYAHGKVGDTQGFDNNLEDAIARFDYDDVSDINALLAGAVARISSGKGDTLDTQNALVAIFLLNSL